jgi:uncharacterized protein (TIGR00369 family)
MPKMTAEQIHAFIQTDFPQVKHFDLRIERLTDDNLLLRLPVKFEHLRPGGTVSGPTLMTVADAGFYFLLLARIGPVALAVTTSLNMNFLRKAAADRDVLAEARFLKLGKRLAVGEVTFTSDGQADAVAHAVLTYSIPV